MNPIHPDDPATKSAEPIAENIAVLQTLFPEAFTEGRIDFEVLKQLLGGNVEEREEKYGLNWHGKRKARQIALSPSTGTLRPCPAESVDWDTTQNLMIEGDNLEVLKLLQKSYAGKVKLIYIDPPYNTGKDFVYPDDFQDNIKNYLELTGQVDSEGRKIGTNSEASGRFHTDWLNMMYPRLKLARNLLTDDGVILISIDDGELPTLRFLCGEVFGEENFVSSLVWKSRQNKDNRSTNGVSVDHEYVVCVGRSLRGAARNLDQYANPDADARGPWTSGNMVGIATADRRPNLHYDLVNPATGVNHGCPAMGWRYDKTSMAKLIAEKRILWPEDPAGRPRKKAFLDDLESDFTGFSSIIGQNVFTRNGAAEMDALFGVRVFDFPKPVDLLKALVEQGSGDQDIVLDFFGGSGTTAHAVWAQNAIDGGKRRCVLVQLPEPLDVRSGEQKTAADFCAKLGKPRTIAELTKERLRRAGTKIRTEILAAKDPLFATAEPAKPLPDLGFRVFKLATSNIAAWSPNRTAIAESLQANADHLKLDRTEQDILYELLLKRGLDLCVPIETRSIAGKQIHSIGAGVLMACLATQISREDVEPLAHGMVAWRKQLNPAGEAQVIFRDSAFADDVAKSNLTQILCQYGFAEKSIRSI